MKILFLTKRHYMAKDLLKDRYGRFYELPIALAESGFDVLVTCLSYYDDGDSNGLQRQEGGVKWQSYYIGRNPLSGIVRYYRVLCRLIAQIKPDVIVGASDSIHVIIADKLARKFNLPCCMDLYDNFESYGQMKLPGLERFYRVEVLGNAVPEGLFFPSDKTRARKELGLPETGRMLGTAGSLHRNRDMESLYRAFMQLAGRHDDLYLVLAGSVDKELPVPMHDRVIYLGNLGYDRVPGLYNALDLGVICNRDDRFRRNCMK